MKNSKKVILFIVEGTTDEGSLGLILSKIVEKNSLVRFRVVRTDITTRDDVNIGNIERKITDEVKEFIKSGSYQKDDILEIVHLVDTDGAYIKDENIEIGECTTYTSENIKTKDIEALKRTHDKKTQILNRLISTNIMYKSIPYSVYFFSCNLEHVLHDKQNIPRCDKEDYAYEFSDKFSNDTQGFISFINNLDFAVQGSYKETWDFIKLGTNSLKRYCNFHIYINKLLT